MKPAVELKFLLRYLSLVLVNILVAFGPLLSIRFSSLHCELSLYILQNPVRETLGTGPPRALTAVQLLG